MLSLSATVPGNEIPIGRASRSRCLPIAQRGTRYMEQLSNSWDKVFILSLYRNKKIEKSKKKNKKQM